MTLRTCFRDPPWTEEEIAQARVLYDQGLSLAVIGREMGGRTKDFVKGVGVRNNWPRRPSPIKVAAVPRKPNLKRIPSGVPTLPPLGNY